MGKVIPVIVVALAASLYPFRMAFFSTFIPYRMWYNFLPSTPKQCPTIDVNKFKKKLIPAPTIKVKDHAECVKFGRIMRHPIICQGIPIDSKKAVEAILGDPTEYKANCYDPKTQLKSIVTHSSPDQRNCTLGDMPNMPQCCAAFIYSQDHQSRLKEVIPHLDDTPPSPKDKDRISGGGSLNFATSFIGNFEDDMISTADHSEPVESMVYQIAGTKVFLMHDHAKSSHPYTYSKVMSPWPSCMDEFIDNVEEFWVGAVKEGSFMYFPLSWGHVVYTTKGLNVMTNVRFLTKKAFFGGLILKDLIGTMMTKLVHGDNQDNNNRRISPWQRFMYDTYKYFDDDTSAEMVRQVLGSYK